MKMNSVRKLLFPLLLINALCVLFVWAGCVGGCMCVALYDRRSCFRVFRLLFRLFLFKSCQCTVQLPATHLLFTCARVIAVVNAPHHTPHSFNKIVHACVRSMPDVRIEKALEGRERCSAFRLSIRTRARAPLEYVAAWLKYENACGSTHITRSCACRCVLGAVRTAREILIHLN